MFMFSCFRPPPPRVEEVAAPAPNHDGVATRETQTEPKGLAGLLCFSLSKKPKIPEAYLAPSQWPGCERVDKVKLKKLILEGKLAPCIPGQEDSTMTAETRSSLAPIVHNAIKQRATRAAKTGQSVKKSPSKRKVHEDLSCEECPICMHFFTIMNTSRCCKHRICTDCYLRVQVASARQSALTCPFCKGQGFVATFQGVKTVEEFEEERAEEQRVIEARIREREVRGRLNEGDPMIMPSGGKRSSNHIVLVGGDSKGRSSSPGEAEDGSDDSDHRGHSPCVSFRTSPAFDPSQCPQSCPLGCPLDSSRPPPPYRAPSACPISTLKRIKGPHKGKHLEQVSPHDLCELTLPSHPTL